VFLSRDAEGDVPPPRDVVGDQAVLVPVPVVGEPRPPLARDDLAPPRALAVRVCEVDRDPVLVDVLVRTGPVAGAGEPGVEVVREQLGLTVFFGLVVCFCLIVVVDVRCDCLLFGVRSEGSERRKEKKTVRPSTKRRIGHTIPTEIVSFITHVGHARPARVVTGRDDAPPA